MKKLHIGIKKFTSFGLLGILWFGCDRDPSDNLTLATFPQTAEVFIDGFVGGLEYLPFEGSKVEAFAVDEQIRFEGSAAMRFDIPNAGDPRGSFAGAIFPDNFGRDLSGFDALTFYARASQAATINEIGFGNDFGENRFLVTRTDLRIGTAWTKYTIAIPDPARLTLERGMFWYAEGPENDNGYSFWIDELQFEKLGNLTQPSPSILNGEDRIEQPFVGSTVEIGGLTQSFTLETGEEQTSTVAPSYFTFSTTNEDVARVNEQGLVTIEGIGTAEITASLDGVSAAGSLRIESLAALARAPIPTLDSNRVISIFSDAYANVSVDFFNGFFEPFQTTLGGVDLNLEGDNIIQYTDLNFVAVEFQNPTVDASIKTHIHIDIQIRESIDPDDFIRVELVDFGANAVFDGGDDSIGSITLQSGDLEGNEWISLDIPLSEFNGLLSTTHLAQILFISDATISTLLVDNIYFYN